MATDGAPVMMLFVSDDDVRVAFGDEAETQLPQAVIEHSKLLKDMQVRALGVLMRVLPTLLQYTIPLRHT